ncbi:MAG TPA: cytochrome C oxidase subunit IV family protein [Gemmatimonadales bacterium]|nr:cytochrome C oxidase subunit IV family protein [Gemmatimonadales bacterium]
MTDTALGPGPGMKLYLMIWVGLLVIVAAEVALTYAGLSRGDLLLGLLLLALLEAILGVLYFMHMKWENRILLFSMAGYFGLALLFMNHIWRDAARMVSMYW